MKHLFDGQMEFDDEEQLHAFLQSINIQESIQLLEIGLNQATENGCFSMNEVIVLYACLQHIKSVPHDNQREKPIPDQPFST
jgi:hypothetical protein